MSALRITGRLEALGRRERVVLAALAVQRPEVGTHDQLANALWPEGAPPTSAKVIQGCVSRLRGLLGADGISTLDNGYRLEAGVVTEADLFTQRVARGRELLQLGQADRAAYALDEALREWSGDPYAEISHWSPAEGASAHLRGEREVAEELYVDALLTSGDAARALSIVRLLVPRAPFREHRWVQLALADYRLGNQAEALDTLRACRATLMDESGIEPGEEIRRLEKAILRQDVAASLPSRAVADTECPWPGLAAYGPDDADCFFGRDISGRGVGRAGDARGPRGRRPFRDRQVIVRGCRGRCHVASPWSERARPRASTRHGRTRLRCPGHRSGRGHLRARGDGAQRTPAGSCRSPRSDRVGDARRPDVAGGLSLVVARIVEQGLFILGALSTEGLATAIEQPAAQRGLWVEPGLIDLFLRDIKGSPVALPQFSHALAQTWARREGRTLTVAGYRVSGGVAGALARTAEEVYAALPQERHPVLRSLMLRLVIVGDDAERRRARVTTRELNEAHGSVVDLLVDARLLDQRRRCCDPDPRSPHRWVAPPGRAA